MLETEAYAKLLDSIFTGELVKSADEHNELLKKTSEVMLWY